MKKLLIYLAIVLVFFVIGILIANFLIMPSIVRMGKVIMVPNVCNMTLEQAIDELQKKKLEGVVTERRYDAVIEEGKVIIQDPLPETKVKEGRIVNLTISLGPETIKIPDLTGVDIEKAKLIIERLEMKIEEVIYEFSDSIDANRVLRSVPQADEEIKKGDRILLFVSKGSQLKMPNLVGQQLETAKIKIGELGLILGDVKEIEGSGEKSSVLLQNPEADQVVKAGDTVSLMVVK